MQIGRFIKKLTVFLCPGSGSWAEDERLCAARDEKTPCPVPVLYTGKTLFKGAHSGRGGSRGSDLEER